VGPQIEVDTRRCHRPMIFLTNHSTLYIANLVAYIEFAMFHFRPIIALDKLAFNVVYCGSISPRTSGIASTTLNCLNLPRRAPSQDQSPICRV
jgi:hypothetical protein